jgi:hypothetical protein
MRTARLASLLAATAATTAFAAAQGWTQRFPATAPSPRAWHGLVYDPTRAVSVLFGGLYGWPVGETWEWNGSNWTNRVTATTPPPRFGHAMGVDHGRARVVMFGGVDATWTDLAETWEYDGTDWTQLTPVTAPGARRDSRMAYDVRGNSMLLFGGGFVRPQITVLADTWRWNGRD